MTSFNIDNSVTVDAELENGCRAKVSHLWDENGNCLQERLGVARWMNVKAACEFLLREPAAVAATTECGVTLRRGRAA